MTATHPYDSMSLMGYQMSILSLAAALDQEAQQGPKEESLDALFEAGQLKDLVDRRAL
jgi:hypothetical protein